MLPKSTRIDAQSHTTLHAKRSVRVFSEHLSLISGDTIKDQKKAKFSVTVSKKVEKTAVGRNRMRRRVYPLLRQLAKKEDARPGVFVFSVLKPLTKVSSSKLAEEIDFLAKKARI